MLQRALRRRLARDQGQRLRSLWPIIDSLRALYIDAEGLSGRQASLELYDDESLIRREALRTAPAVTRALDTACVLG